MNTLIIALIVLALFIVVVWSLAERKSEAQDDDADIKPGRENGTGT